MAIIHLWNACKLQTELPVYTSYFLPKTFNWIKLLNIEIIVPYMRVLSSIICTLSVFFVCKHMYIKQFSNLNVNS